jgi:hypothetical protein
MDNHCTSLVEIKIQNCVKVEFSTNGNQDNITHEKKHEMAPLITHKNSLAKNTWTTKSTIVLKQTITTNNQKLTKCMQSIKKKWIKCHHHHLMANHSTNHVDNKIYNDENP